MLFETLLATDDQRHAYRLLLGDMGGLLRDVVRQMVRAFEITLAAVAVDDQRFHSTILMLARHTISSIDGVSVLVPQGCAEASAPLLRSAFEAWLGIRYILNGDRDRRALAYHAAHIHRKINFYHRLDSSRESGKKLRAELDGDPYADVLLNLPIDPAAPADRLERLLRELEYAPIEAEWQATKGKKSADPNWFALFGGPPTVRELAKTLGRSSLYQFLY